MNIIFKTLLMYIAIIVLILSFSYSFISNDVKQLKILDSQLSGVEYLKNLNLLSLSVIKYMDSTLKHKKEVESSKQDILTNISKIYMQQNKNKKYIDSDFNTQLELIATFEMSENDYYNFLDSINHQNYDIGDKSRLLFEEDRKLYFLGSLVTHYMPEYFISILLCHNIIEELHSQKTISDEKKNIFIEQTKLVRLSIEEISKIIKLLTNYKDTKKLEPYILSIEQEIRNLNNFTPSIYKWNNNQVKIEVNLHTFHEILDLSFTLNDESFSIVESELTKKKKALKTKILQNSIIFLIIIFLITILMYIYYKANSLNVKKDKEIKSINNILDKFVVFIKTDKNGVITYASSALVALCGYSREELLGNTTRVFKHEDTKPEVYKEMWGTILAKKIYSVTLLNRRKNTTPYWARVVIIPELDKNSELLGFSSYIVDVTQEKALEEEKLKTQTKANELLVVNKELERLTVIDRLTQIYNRLKLDTVLQSNYENYQRYKRVFSIILIDVDYFKSVNDTYGHLVGDEILKGIVDIIGVNIRKSDILGRWGGEEFMVICPETDIDGTYKLAQKIREAIQEYSFKIVGNKTVSLGVTQIEEHLSIHDFINRADDALYKAKNNGRNRVEIL